MTNTTVNSATLAMPQTNLSLDRPISPTTGARLIAQESITVQRTLAVNAHLTARMKPNPQAEALSSQPAVAPSLAGLGIQLQFPPATANTDLYSNANSDDYPQLLQTAHPPDDAFYDFYRSRPGLQNSDDPAFADPCSSWLHPISSNSSSSQGINEVASSTQHDCGLADIWGMDSFSGLPPGVFGAQLPTPTDIALQYLCQTSQATGQHPAVSVDCPSGDISSNLGKHFHSSIVAARLAGADATSDPGYRQIYTSQGSSLCINPAELLGEVYDSGTFQDNSSSSSVSSSLNSVQSRHAYSILGYPPMSTDDLAKPDGPPTTPPEILESHLNEIASNNSGNPVFDFTRSQKRSWEASDYAPSPKPVSSPNSTSSPFPSPPKRRTRGRTSKNTRKPSKASSKAAVVSSNTTEPDEIKNDESHTVILGTPVLDAHRGVHIEDLEAKAERYKLRNPGMEYDKRWLLSFAGKLTPRGELLDEYRCYIIGCSQTNKRRDHILIHLGAHLDQRPFQCQYWFLRKNECKRHELGHIGTRPFSCDLCPFEEVTFVRQDLLKRHLKRTHHIEATGKANKENQPDTRKPVKKTRHTR